MDLPAKCNTSIGMGLIDTLDQFIQLGRIEPQLAMKVLATFDRVMAEVMADRVKARLTFKVTQCRRPWLAVSAANSRLQGPSRYLSVLR